MKSISDSSVVRSRIVLGIAALVFSATGCANMNHAQSGALTGTALGSVAGAMIGGESGHAGGGAVVGAITGAMAGTVIGDAEDARVERDVAYAQRDGAIAQAQYLAQQQQQPGLTNFDLIRLTQSGVSDDIIVNMISTRGGEFELGTDAVISLKSNGVTDRVIVAAQSAPAAAVITPTAASIPPQPGVVVVQPQPTVIVEPGPPAYWGGWGYHRHRYHRHHPSSRVGFSFGF